jgi:hypothetical protein
MISLTVNFSLGLTDYGPLSQSDGAGAKIDLAIKCFQACTRNLVFPPNTNTNTNTPVPSQASTSNLSPLFMDKDIVQIPELMLSAPMPVYLGGFLEKGAEIDDLVYATS